MPDRNELARLFGAMSDGTIGPDDHGRLQQLLSESAEIRQQWFLFSDLERGLCRWAETRQPPVDIPTLLPTGVPASPAPRRSRGWQVLALLMTTVVLLTVGTTLLMDRFLSTPNVVREGQRPSGTAAPAVVRVMLLADCQWNNATFSEGQALPPGAVMRLKRGTAVLRFDGGADVILSAETGIEVVSRAAVRLLAGRLTVRAPEQATGFVVLTPAGEVEDLGTEFAVYVGQRGETEVHVLAGQVAVPAEVTGENRKLIVDAGNAVRVERDSPTAQAVPLKSPRFMDLVDEARAKPARRWLMARESFDYPIGAVALREAIGGEGWDGPWRLPATAATSDPLAGTMEVDSGVLNRSWPVTGGHGPAFRFRPDSGTRVRRLSTPVRLDTDAVYYFSVMIRQEQPSTGDPSPSRVCVGLRSERRFYGDRLLFRMGTIGKRQIEVRRGECFVSPAVPRDGAQFWVGKIVAREAGEDEVCFRVYEEGEPFDLIEPVVWDVQTRFFESDAQLDVVELTAVGEGVCWFDELRIGTNWRAAAFPGDRTAAGSRPQRLDNSLNGQIRLAPMTAGSLE